MVDDLDDTKLLEEPAQDSLIQNMANNIVYTVLVMKIAQVFQDDLLHKLAGPHLIGMYSTLYHDNETSEWAQEVSQGIDQFFQYTSLTLYVDSPSRHNNRGKNSISQHLEVFERLSCQEVMLL